MGSEKDQENVESMLDKGYEYFGNGRTYGTRSPFVEGSDEKSWMLNDHHDDDCCSFLLFLANYTLTKVLFTGCIPTC